MENTTTRRRPYMKNYGIAKEDKGLLEWEWVDAQMAKSRNYWIVTTRPDGRPHAAPVWGIWYEGAFYFSTDPGAQKARNFEHQPEIVVHLESGDDTVILEGRIDKTTDKAVIESVDKLYGAKYPYDPTPSAFYYVLRPKTALAWLESDFMHSATRWDFE
jgi:nitroimidazol reductase NimA-like FMN-containing flavoprotein (pyridoxamine 5'-phosphate oxidase superfamily)